MSNIALIVTAFASAISGGACLALSQDRHWRSMGLAPSVVAPTVKLRSIGSLFLVLCFVICVLRDGASFALILWPLTVGAAIISIGLVLTYKPATLGPLARIASKL